MTKDNNEKRTLDFPDNISLPFFAYGIFKPGQLAYSKIRNRVKENDNVEINYNMKHRDGVPILINRESDYLRTKGVIITFRKGQEKESYKIICNTLLRNLYEWKTIEINGQEVNVLFGVNPNNGSSAIENPKEKVNFDGKNDPLFNEAIDLIKQNLKLNKRPNTNLKSKETENIEMFFNLQMNYMLLWSAIDRFCSLKYNRNQTQNIKKFANQKAFKDSIKKFENKEHRPVYSTDHLKMHKFNANDPDETMFYYYTFRCNVVHRGKATIGDYEMLKQATYELLEIFEDVLKSTFNE